MPEPEVEPQADTATVESTTEPVKDAREAPIAKTLGTMIREARVKIGMTQAALSKRLRVSTSYVCKVETDQQVPGEGVVGRIAQELRLNASRLLRMRSQLAQQRKELMRQQRTVRILEEDGIPVPKTQEQQLGEEIIASRDLRKAVEYLREIAADADLFPAAMGVLKELATSARLKKQQRK